MSFELPGAGVPRRRRVGASLNVMVLKASLSMLASVVLAGKNSVPRQARRDHWKRRCIKRPHLIAEVGWRLLVRRTRVGRREASGGHARIQYSNLVVPGVCLDFQAEQ